MRFRGHERGASEKNVDTKYMQLNVLRNIACMAKRGDDIPTYWIGRKCPDALGM